MTFAKLTPPPLIKDKEHPRNIVWIHGFGIAIEHETAQGDEIRYCELLWENEKQLLGIKLLSKGSQTAWELKEANGMKVIRKTSKADLNLPHGVYRLEKADNADYDLICNLKTPTINLEERINEE